MDTGIDYGLGRTNIDRDNGIRFGVIHQNEVLQSWADSSEADYGKPGCPKCGASEGEVDEDDNLIFSESAGFDDADWNDGKDYACARCEQTFWSDICFPEQALAFTLDDGEYKAEQNGDDCDIFVLKSPFYTRAQFCSPCAPGAAYLMNPTDDGPRAYCFGHDWFDEGKAPYPVYRVSDDSLVNPEN